MFNLKKMLFD